MTRSYTRTADPLVHIDVPTLQSRIRRDRRSITRLMQDAGLDKATYWRIKERGRCLLSTADRLSGALGCNLYEIEAQ